MTTETPLALFFLGCIAGSLVIMAAALVVMMSELRRTLHRVTEVLPNVERALREATRSVHHVRRLLARADGTSQHVESVVRQACDAAAGIVQGFARFKERTNAFLHQRFGNGAGTGPRRHHRRG